MQLNENMKKILVLVSIVAFMGSCGMKEMMEKTNLMTEIILSNCDCDDVRLLSYEEATKGAITAYFEVVGTDIEKQDSVAVEINTALKKMISDYCDIDNLTLDFINKGQHNIIEIESCEVKKQHITKE